MNLGAEGTRVTVEELRLLGRPSSRMRSALSLAHAHRLPWSSPARTGPRLLLAARHPGIPEDGSSEGMEREKKEAEQGFRGTGTGVPEFPTLGLYLLSAQGRWVIDCRALSIK